ncbi:MAG: SIMPL domain-containing protein [Gammaproteobacteria bacterium]|nr:SIMPL domain-containing protein [Gammaproteobacteria bacterium]
MNKKLIPLLVIFLLPIHPVWADEDVLFNQIHINAQVERDVENDQLEVSMVVEKQGNRPEDIAYEVNETMQWALEQAEGKSEIEINTRSYQTFPIYKNRLIVGWRATQELLLKSTDITELTDLVGELQERLQVRNMQFSPTRETRVRIENELISEAMEAFRQRADIIKQHMDEDEYRIVNLHVNTGNSGPVMYRDAMVSRAATMDMAMEMAPAVEAGTSKVIVTVSGSIQFF